MLGITSSIIMKWMKVAIVLFGIFDSVLDVQEVQNKSELYIVSYVSLPEMMSSTLTIVDGSDVRRRTDGFWKGQT